MAKIVVNGVEIDGNIQGANVNIGGNQIGNGNVMVNGTIRGANVNIGGNQVFNGEMSINGENHDGINIIIDVAKVNEFEMSESGKRYNVVFQNADGTIAITFVGGRVTYNKDYHYAYVWDDTMGKNNRHYILYKIDNNVVSHYGTYSSYRAFSDALEVLTDL